jgi:integrase
VPRHLEGKIGRSHVTRSLGTGYRREAIRKSRIVLADIERMFLLAEGRAVPELPIARAAPPLAVAPSVARSFDELLDLFLADLSKHRGHKTVLLYENLRAVARGFWGPEKPVAEIDRTTCRELLNLLRWLPSNPAKRFPKLSLMEAAQFAKAEGLTSTLTAASVNGYMVKLRSVLNFGVNEGWIERNPAKGLRVVDPVRRRDKRLPFSTDQLRLIFNAPLYTGCMDDEWHYDCIGPNRPRRGRFWVPLIALFSGMRLNEICQLDVADILRIEGVDCFFVSAGTQSPDNDKRLKTTSSERYVPVHPELRAIGFMEFVEQQRAAGVKKLFPELPISTTGYYSDPFSKWFRRFLAKARATAPKTCFHSFRHSYRDALREARIPHEVALALGGWASSGGAGEAEVSSAYGRGYRMSTLAGAIAKVTYPGLDLSHLTRSEGAAVR